MNMGQNGLRLVFCVLFFFLTQRTFSANSKTYRAAVVEYYPVQTRDLSPDERTTANVNKYIELANTLGGEKLDILVYPESTLTTGVFPTRDNLIEIAVEVPEESGKVNPCRADTHPNFFKELSCLASRLKTYLVVNLIEKARCTPSENCAPDSWNMYNTDVVFDRDGVVIQRYRKYNPFGEAEMNITAEAEVATFETDFGVTFGLFTCFDILFEKPALLLVRQGVKHLIFPTMWFSELPFLTALQAQNMFAIENDVVVLAAGANSARVGSGGTGIYQGQLGPVVYDIIADDGTKVYVADVLKEWTASTPLDHRIPLNESRVDDLALEMDNFFLKLDNLSLYSAYPAFDKEFSGVFETEGISCRVSWKINYENITDPHYDYVFFYYSGMRSFSGVRDGAVDVCGLVSCQDILSQEYYTDSCAKRYQKYEDIKWPYDIQELVISANFTAAHTAAQYPSVLLSSIRPLERADYEWTSRYFEDGQTVEKTLKLLKPQDRLMTFAIYGRDFARDNSASWMSRNNFLMLVTLLLAVFLIL